MAVSIVLLSAFCWSQLISKSQLSEVKVEKNTQISAAKGQSRSADGMLLSGIYVVLVRYFYTEK